jgi:transposase
MTALCVVDHDGALLAEGKLASEPEALADWLGAHAPEACRIGLDTGPLSVWLWNELKERGLAVHVIDARHVKAGLVLQARKTDRNDARGLAQIMRTCWFKKVRVRSPRRHICCAPCWPAAGRDHRLLRNGPPARAYAVEPQPSR